MYLHREKSNMTLEKQFQKITEWTLYLTSGLIE